MNCWQQHDLNKKLYVATIEPPECTLSNFPIKSKFIKLPPKDTIKQLLTWFNPNLIFLWFVQRKALRSYSLGRSLCLNNFLKNILYYEKYDDCFFRGVCSATMKKNVAYDVTVHINCVSRKIMKCRCSCFAGAGNNAACRHVSTILHALEIYIHTGTIKLTL